MPSTSPDINKLKADKNEKELIGALNNHDDPDIPGEAAEALAGIGSVPSLEPLCLLMEDSEQSTEVRIKTVTAIGDICARLLKVLDRIDPDSLSDDELLKHREENRILSEIGARLKSSIKTGPHELRKAAGIAYMILPLEDDSDIMKAFSNGSTVTFQSTPTPIDTFAHSPDESDSPSTEPEEQVQSIEDDPEDHSDELNEEAEVESEPKDQTEVQTKTKKVTLPEPNLDKPVEIAPKTIKEKELSEPNLDELIEIAPNTYWLATRDGTLLERNIYLRIFSNGEETINLLIDPGPPEDLPALIRVLSSKIGGLKNIDVMFLNHQDPDVAYNAGHLQELNPDCIVLCTEDTWRLVRFYGLNPKKYRAIEQFKDLSVEISPGQRLRFVPSPYCHFRGAVMLFDEETGVLFTGDFLGGLSFKPDLFAGEDTWNGISIFQQIYMPCQAAIRNAVKNIRNLNHLPEMIAPQHGSIISGDLVNDFLTRVANLEVGIDLFLKEHTKESYIEAMNDLLAEFGKIAGPTIVTEALNAFYSGSSLPNMISLGANGVHDIKVDPYHAVEILLHELRSKTPSELWNEIEITIVKVLTRRKIAIPNSILLKARDEMVFNSADMFMSENSEDSK